MVSEQHNKPVRPERSAGPAGAESRGGSERRDPIDDCIHCGFCLPHCPTYVSWGEEMDSPRGRIDLMRGLREGRLELSEVVVSHFDRCLGCMACVTACPSGVRYDRLIERTRAEVEARGRPLMERLWRGLLFALFPHPRRLRALLPFLWLYTRTGLRWVVHRTGLLRLLPRRVVQLEALLPSVGLEQFSVRLPTFTPAHGALRARVALVAGCVQRVFFPAVNAATVRVLSAEGCEVVIPPGQGCCGALSIHAGREAEAKRMAKALIERMERSGADVVVVNAAGCGSHLKDYGHLLADEPAWAARAAAFAARVRDASELLAWLPPAAPRSPVAARVVYQPSCHLVHAQGLRTEPQAVLRTIPGLELYELADTCCGSAGVYNLLEPASADEIGARKVDAVIAARPTLVASGNPGCLLQLQKLLRARGIAVRVAHPIEILDASIRGTGVAPQPVAMASAEDSNRPAHVPIATDARASAGAPPTGRQETARRA